MSFEWRGPGDMAGREWALWGPTRREPDCYGISIYCTSGNTGQGENCAEAAGVHAGSCL